MLYKERFKSAQECLTDKHGRWTLSGPVEARGVARLTSYLTLYRTMEPRFYVYCKGYVERGWATYRFNGFSARPFHDEKTGIAGILLIKPGDTEEEKRTYREKYTSAFTVPLVPTDNPQERLEHLDFNFEYAPDTRMIGSSFSSRESYVVYGLKKRTRSSSKFGGYPDLPFSAKAQVPILYQRKHPRHQGLLVPPQVTSGRVIEVQRSDAGGLK